MKTTVELDDALFRAAKKMAVDRGCTLRQMIESGLRLEMQRSQPKRRRRTPGPGEWISSPTPLELPPGVDLRDRSTIWRWIESEQAKELDRD